MKIESLFNKQKENGKPRKLAFTRPGLRGKLATNSPRSRRKKARGNALPSRGRCSPSKVLPLRERGSRRDSSDRGRSGEGKKPLRGRGTHSGGEVQGGAGGGGFLYPSKKETLCRQGKGAQPAARTPSTGGEKKMPREKLPLQHAAVLKKEGAAWPILATGSPPQRRSECSGQGKKKRRENHLYCPGTKRNSTTAEKSPKEKGKRRGKKHFSVVTGGNLSASGSARGETPDEPHVMPERNKGTFLSLQRVPTLSVSKKRRRKGAARGRKKKRKGGGKKGALYRFLEKTN